MDDSTQENPQKRKLLKAKKDQSDSKSQNENEPSDELTVDIKNEQLALGQALNDRKCFSILVSQASWEDFLVENHKVIAWCLHEAFDQNLEITDDVFDVLRLNFPGSSKSTGGYKYIKELREVYSDGIKFGAYERHVQKLRSDSIKSRIANQFTTELLRMVYNPSSTVEEILEHASGLDSLVRESYQIEKRGFKTMEEVNRFHDEEIKSRGSLTNFTTTGMRWLDDHLTDGFAPGKITVIGGRPGMGKSAFVANSMVRLGNRKPKPIPNALFALEMDAVSTVDRMNAIESDIQLKKLIKDRHELTSEEKKIESDVKLRREAKPIYICDDVRKSLPEIKRELRALKERFGVQVAFIDLFMKIRKPGNLGNRSTADQYTEMLNEIQRIARELHLHIVLVVQIGRKAEARTDKRPTISDLKDSGAYEEIADNIFLFYREGYYLQKDAGLEFNEDILEIIIGKQRQGETGTVYALYQGPTTKIKKANERDVEEFRIKIDKFKASKKKRQTNFSGKTQPVYRAQD